MKQLFTCIAALAFLFIHAQPVINSNVVPVMGATATFFKSSGANAFNAGATGANVTWNFAHLDTSQGTIVQKVVDPDTIFLGFAFPSICNMALETKAAFNISNYAYAFVDNSKFEFYGFQSIGAQVYSNPELHLTFPFTYNSQFTDYFHDEDTFRYGKIVVKADAYGTLILPKGTFGNVLRVNFKEDYADYDEDYDQDGIPDDSTLYEGQYYRWYLPNQASPLLEYSSLRRYGVYQGVKIYYPDSIKHIAMSLRGYTALEDVEADFALSIYPNPAKNRLQVNAALPIQNAELLDISGKLLLQEQFYDTKGILNLENLSAGTYFLQITTTDNRRKTVKVLRL